MMTDAARNAQVPQVSAAPAVGPQRPYRPAEAAALLGLTRAQVERYYPALGGVKVGALVIIPRATVDRLVGLPPPEPAPAVERVLALVGLLDWRECGLVIAAAAQRLAQQQRPTL